MFTIYTGNKIKGLFTEEQVIAYMANRKAEDVADLVVMELKPANLAKQIDSERARILADRAARLSGRTVHHLRAEDVEVKATAKQGKK